MSKPLKVGNTASLDALDKEYESRQEHHDRERLLAIRLTHQGKYTLEQIGSIMKRGRATVARWLKAYREGGIEQLLDRGHGGGPEASLSQVVQVEIIIKLLSGCWKRVKDIQIWLQQAHGIDLKLS